MDQDQFAAMMKLLTNISDKLDSIYSDMPASTPAHDLDDIYRQMTSLIAAVERLEP